jgi:hypothetical protein
MWGVVTVSPGSFAPGTVVSLVERDAAHREDFQVTFAPDPRCPARRENMPPSELPVYMTATADTDGQVTFTLAPMAPPYEMFFWALGWDVLAASWKRLAVSHTPTWWW